MCSSRENTTSCFAVADGRRASHPQHSSLRHRLRERRREVSAASSSSTVFPAVITVTGSQHVKLLSFAVEAAKDEVGILLDGTGKLSATPPSDTGIAEVRASTVAIDPESSTSPSKI